MSQTDNVSSSLNSLRITAGGRGRGRGRGRGTGGFRGSWREQNYTDAMVNFKEAAADIGEPLIFIGGQALGMNIDDWPGMKPSECWMHEGISQVQVYRNEAIKSEDDKIYENMKEKKETIKKEFADMKKNHSEDHKTVTKSSMKELAEKHNLTTGKWIIPVPWTRADKVWDKLVRGLLAGKFPDDLSVIFVRVHGRSDPESNPHNDVRGKTYPNAMMSVVTGDWTDEEKTLEVAKVIRELGITASEGGLKYKADIYTVVDIYRRNDYKLGPVYTYNN